MKLFLCIAQRTPDALIASECKLWGFLLRHLFGVTVGMGDHAHLTVAHSAMLFREPRSFRHYSNQGFEASHKEQRMRYSRATSHDSSSEGLSSKCFAAFKILL